MSVESIRSQLSDALDSRDVLRAANLLVGPEATAHAGALFAWVNEATRNGQEDLALELLSRPQVSAATRDYGLSCIFNQLVRDSGRLPAALEALRQVTNSWNVSSGTGDILQMVVHKLGRAHSKTGPLPGVPIVMDRSQEAVWRGFCLELAQWGVSLVESAEESDLLLTALLDRADRLEGSWGKALRSVVAVQSRLCALNIDLGEADVSSENDPEDAFLTAQNRQNLAWERARFGSAAEVSEVLETLRDEWCIDQATGFVCEEFLGRGLVDDALGILRRFDAGSGLLAEVAKQMITLGRETEVREVLDEVSGSDRKLRALLEFEAFYSLTERESGIRYHLKQMASESVVGLGFLYPKLAKAGYEELFWNSLPEGYTPYHTIVEACVWEKESELLRAILLRSLDEPGLEWHMVPTLATMFPEQSREVGEFILSRFVEPPEDNSFGN